MQNFAFCIKSFLMAKDEFPSLAQRLSSTCSRRCECRAQVTRAYRTRSTLLNIGVTQTIFAYMYFNGTYHTYIKMICPSIKSFYTTFQLPQDSQLSTFSLFTTQHFAVTRRWLIALPAFGTMYPQSSSHSFHMFSLLSRACIKVFTFFLPLLSQMLQNSRKVICRRTCCTAYKLTPSRPAMKKCTGTNHYAL